MNDIPNTNQPQSSDQPPPQTTWSPVAQAMRHDLESPLTKQGNPIDPQDPGSGFTRFIAILLSILVVGIVVLWQNSGDDWKYKYLLNKPVPVEELNAETSAPGSFGQVDLVGRVYLRNYTAFKSQPVLSMIDNGTVPFTPEDQIRLSILAGAFENEENALTRLNTLESDLILEDEPDELVLAEINALRTLYTVGPEALEDHQRDQLNNRYQLLGKFALTHGMSDTDPDRAALIMNPLWIIIFGLGAIAIAIIVPITGFVLLILGFVYFASGKLKFRSHVPTKGGSVFLETYALFVAGFVLMAIGAFFVQNSSNPELAGLTLLVQWLLLLTVLWGLIRGMRFNTWRHAIGWDRGQGVFKEIGIGIVSYIASIPIYILGVIITVIVLMIQGAIQTSANGGVPEPQSVSNPILEMIANGNWVSTLLLFVLATTWAPIVEEAIFRGALYRHLRGSMHWVIAGLLSATLFAYMHDYGPLMVAPLIALGFMFSFMREWRGSLIAPMTAHFLHNFSLMSFMIILIQLIKDPII